jgi:alkylhydroperoxidase/carboxymuconolactone decarboxylase family protein YurZ
MYQSERTVLTELDTSQLSLASLVTMDVPKQLSWHIRGFMNLGGTREELVKTLKIAKTVVDITGVQLKHKMPDVDETIGAVKLV